MPRKRAYTLKQRAQSQEDTRQRIVDAAMQLHEELGPRATSISAIAERAGVQRLTVYRHFPTDADVFAACSSNWLSQNPPPSAALWAEATGIERMRIALQAYCAYYSGTQTMLSRVHGDAHDLPALRDGPLKAQREYLDGVAKEIAREPGHRPARQVLATLRHALDFTTWAELEAQGLSDREKAALMLTWVRGAAA